MTFEQEQSELLEQYLTELELNPRALPPRGLDPETITTFQKMNRHLTVPLPDAEYVASLRARLDRDASRAQPSLPKSPRSGFLSFPRWSLVGLAAAVFIALLGILLLATRPQSASAQELLNHARSAASELQSVGVNSFEMVQASSAVLVDDPNAPPTRAARGETKTWYAGPTRWRIETHYDSTGQPPLNNLTVSDGAAQWEYNASENTVLVQTAESRNIPFPSVLSLDLLQQDMSNCYEPKVLGEETIAGRAAYKVSLGIAKCRSAAAPELNGPHTVWLDKETFFVLKSEIRALNHDQITSSLEVKEIKYNLDLPGDLFTFTPPPGASVNDLRPKPAPNAQEYVNQLTALAQRVDFPIFAPSAAPNDLVARAPQYNEIEKQIELAYVTPGEESTNTPADMQGILVVEKRADYELVRNWTDGAEPLTLGGGQAWVRRGDFDPGSGTGSNSAVLLVRDGTLISISSFRIKPDQLIETAKSLQIVPGGHAPLPNPTPPTIDEIRAQSDFPFFIPTYVPAGLAPEPPTSQQLQYHRAGGALALIVQNAKQGEGGMEQEPRFKGESVKLANGIDAHLLLFEPEIVILWWNQDGGYVSLEGHAISRDEMLTVAASMSSTAPLGGTQAPPARPAPTPILAPSVTPLRPTWLPEEMTVMEKAISSSDNQASGIEIRFDPHPDGTPHDVMTLTEFPKQYAENNFDDPQLVKKDIAGRSVSVIKRGKGCVTYYWVQDAVALTLTNPYDPPGAPGEVRYSCEQMEKVIASIQ